MGLCFSPTLARANHSCTPNAFIVFDSRNVSLQALRPIKRDEEIFISYIDPTEEIAQRQSTLKHRYFFTCKCPRCEGNENHYGHFLRCRKEGIYDDAVARIDVLCPHQDVVRTAEHCQATLKQNPALTSIPPVTSSKALALLKQGHTNQQHRTLDLLAALKSLSSYKDDKIFALPPFPETLHELYLSYIDAQTFTPALITLLFLFVNCDIFMYPQPHHPVRVVRLWTIAKLLKHIASLNPTELLQDISSIQLASPSSSSSDLSVKEDIANTFQAIDLINAFHVLAIVVWSEASKSHGEDSGFLKEIEAEIRDVEEVQRLRGKTGEVLRRWMGEAGDLEGRKEAERVIREVRGLAGLMGRILGWV